VFGLVIFCGEIPFGLLSDLWGRKKTLLLGSALKAVSFSLLPLWSTYEGFCAKLGSTRARPGGDRERMLCYLHSSDPPLSRAARRGLC
jgi:MFS family permease